MDGDGSTRADAPTTGAPPIDTPPSSSAASTGTPQTSGKPGEPPGLRAQFGSTIGAGKRLIRAHIDLAKAELGEIMGAVGRMVGLFAGAFVLVLFAATLLAVGGMLFLGEWLFGSIGWGVLLGVVLLIDLALVLVLVALDVAPRRIGVSLGIGLVVGLVVGIVMALDLTHRGWTALGDSVAAAYSPDTRAVLLAVGVSAIVLGMLGFVTGIRSGFGHAWGRLIVWAIIGVLLALLTVVSLPTQVGAAIGVLAALITWPILAGLDVARTGIDGEAMKKKFTPEQTIELTKETIEWVRARTPLVPKS